MVISPPITVMSVNSIEERVSIIRCAECSTGFWEVAIDWLLHYSFMKLTNWLIILIRPPLQILGVWLTYRYRNQKDPRANPSAFLWPGNLSKGTEYDFSCILKKWILHWFGSSSHSVKVCTLEMGLHTSRHLLFWFLLYFSWINWFELLFDTCVMKQDANRWVQ